MIAATSFVSSSTKPKPRERPVSRSVITWALCTVPYVLKRFSSAASSRLHGKFPTNNLTYIRFSLACVRTQPCYRGGSLSTATTSIQTIKTARDEPDNASGYHYRALNVFASTSMKSRRADRGRRPRIADARLAVPYVGQYN